jgi:RepB DNA-primase from phage plasmid
MPFNIKEGHQMIDLFTSVGATSFLVTKLDINKKVLWCKPYSPREFRDKLLPIMRTAAVRHPIALEDGREVAAGENLIIRPSGDTIAFVQLDDLKVEQLDRVRPAAFIIHSTSPGNYQAWFAVSGVSKDKEEFKEFMRRVRKAVGGNDKSASHATRVCGSENFKPEYAEDFPVVTTVHGAPGRVVTAERLSQMGLLADSEPVKEWTPATYRSPHIGNRIWPSYDKCLAGAPMNKKGTGPDRSLADYTFCKFAAQRGFTVEEIAAELPNVSSKARERVNGSDPGYVTKTAENGYDAAHRGKLRSR